MYIKTLIIGFFLHDLIVDAYEAPSRVRDRRRIAGTRSACPVRIVCAGNPQFSGAEQKTCPIDELKSLLDHIDVEFVSLQNGAPAESASR